MTSVSPMADLIMTNVAPARWSHTISSRQQLIGRGPTAEILIPSKFTSVSRSHAQVWAESDGIWIKDLGSLLGTRVNGVPVEGMDQAPVSIGDRLWLAGLQLDVIAHVPKNGGGPQVNHSASDLRSTQSMNLPSANPPNLAELSVAERQVVLWMGQGILEDAAIGKKLHRSPNTVRTQVGSIFQKLDLHSRAEVLTVLRRMMAAPPPNLVQGTNGFDHTDSEEADSEEVVDVDPNRTR